jgi:hypothetical protein
MSAGDWSIQVHPINGFPEAEIYFADFDAMLVFARKFRKRLSDDVLRAHIPAGATAEQREKLTELGCIPL